VDLTITVRQERPGYWARVVELPGCFASGRSLAELREALGEAIALYLWDSTETLTLSGYTLEVGQTRIQVVEPFPY
jgi:predicted RNase H-like HicB family nuclease